MKEKRKEKHNKKHKHDSEKSNKRKRRKSPSSNCSDSDEWVEKEPTKSESMREDWMSMTGMLKTYTKDDVKPKRDEHKEKQHIDSYNPGTSSRELNPYWKDGGSGLPQTPESWRKSKPFLKPTDDNDFYSRSRQNEYKETENKPDSSTSNRYKSDYYAGGNKSKNWKKSDANYDRRDSHTKSHIEISTRSDEVKQKNDEKTISTVDPNVNIKSDTQKDTKYLSDEKMNKLAAKIVKAEIMGDVKLVADLKAKLEAAREYRKQNPDAGKEDNDEAIMLMSTTSTGNSRPLTCSKGDPRSKGGKRKAETYHSGERMKYYGNDDKYNLAEMFQQEKYGNNYEDEAELAKIASKHTNPNDDLEDIFVDEISKNKNAAKQSEIEEQRAINQHKKIEKSLEGCEYCIDSKNMLKHLMVSCGNKVYVALPAKKSLVKGQCIITTIQHSTCVTALDEDIWEEILNYRKAITKFFNAQNKDVLFFETATRLHRFPHVVINCMPMPRDVGDTAPIYFKKALLECEAEWSMNKKVVDLKGKDIRRGIPKGLPYFWVDFGMDPGFAHVIEDQQLFPKNFAEEIVGGILDIDHNLWKNPKKEYGDLQRKKVLEFIKEWKPFDPMAKNSE